MNGRRLLISERVERHETYAYKIEIGLWILTEEIHTIDSTIPEEMHHKFSHFVDEPKKSDVLEYYYLSPAFDIDREAGLVRSRSDYIVPPEEAVLLPDFSTERLFHDSSLRIGEIFRWNPLRPVRILPGDSLYALELWNQESMRRRGVVS